MTSTDIKIYTDGSGHINGFGGWAAFITTLDGILKTFKMGGCCGTSVDRMEFTALLEGLQGAWEMSRAMPESNIPDWRPSVLWFSDRESLVHSVKRLNSRSNCPDLWVRFEWYERVMDITAQFMTDELMKTSLEFKEVDLQSSIGYQMYKSYVSGKPFSPGFDYNY